MTPFDFLLPTRIVFGSGCIEQLGTLARKWDRPRCLVISDPGIVSAGHTARGIAALQAAGVETCLFDAVQENPTTEDVDRGVEVCRDFRPELMVAIGGGSSMDCCKGINFLHTNGGRMQDYWGVGKAQHPMLPMFAVPTTAGTGSEAQSFALISDAETHAKMACGDKKAAFRIALLDPDLTLTQPRRVTVLTGLDAIAHALETLVTKKRNLMSQAFSREAWRHLAPNFRRVLEDPEDPEARAAMQLGACFAGLAIENSMLGAAHALANPLSAAYGVVHGQAVGVMLPHVIRFNGEQFAELYRQLLEVTSGIPGLPTVEQGVEGLAEFITDLLSETGLAGRLNDLQVPETDLPQLAENAAQQWTGTFNPRSVSSGEWLALYQAAF